MAASTEENERFASAFSVALSAVGPNIEPKLSVPVAISVDGMKDVFRAATSQNLGTFVYGAVANLAAKAISEASYGGLDSFISEGAGSLGGALSEVSSALGSVLDVVPFVGDMIEGMVSALNGYEQAERERLARIRARMVTECQDDFNTDRPGPTGPNREVTPADLFRALAEQTGQLHGTPTTAATCFALLCGDQARGPFRFPDVPLDPAARTPEQSYALWLEQARAKYGPRIGIDRETRRTMWLLIEGIMAARRPYTLEYVEPLGDQGRVLFPVLCDLVLSEWQQRHSWSVESVQDMFSWVTPTCAPYVDMGTVLESTLMGWKYTVQPAGYTDWLARAAEYEGRALRRPRTGLIGLSARDAVRLVSKSEQAVAAQRSAPAPLSPIAGLAVGTAAVAGSYGAWYAMRRWGPGERARG